MFKKPKLMLSVRVEESLTLILKDLSSQLKLSQGELIELLIRALYHDLHEDDVNNYDRLIRSCRERLKN